MRIADIKTNMGSPALRALETLGIVLVEDFNKYTRREIADAHGIGPKAIRIIENEMIKNKVRFGNEVESIEVDTYIEGFPDEIRNKLVELRKLLRDILPEAEEKMAYGMPTYFYKENVVHFAGYKEHIGFYPTPSGIDTFSKKLTVYKTSKGAIQFPINKELPRDLIMEITTYRMNEITKKKAPVGLP